MKAPPSPRDERWRGALSVSLVGCIVTLVAATMPEAGWSVAGQALRVALPDAWRRMLTPEETQPVIPRWRPEDVAELLAQYDSGWAAATAPVDVAPPAADAPPATVGSDSVAAQDGPITPAASPAPDVSTAPVVAQAASSAPSTSPAIPEVGALPPALRINIPEAAQPAFGRLFAGLDEHGQVNVLHYGDSQIEGDRISGVMRNAWQRRWGGYGPGIQAAVPLVQSFALEQVQIGPWKRHTRYGRRDSSDVDERYGLMACYADLALAPGTAGEPPCLLVSPERRNHPQFGRWTGVRLWHDSVAVPCTLVLNGYAADTLLPGTPAGTRDLFPLGPDAAPEGMGPAAVCFEGTPPRIFALEPIGAGVQWHGIPMRGSSGTLFRKLDRELLLGQWRQLNPELVILQYGGNVVPHTDGPEQAQRYAGWFAGQIRLLKATLPQAAILVIGPSDMAEKRSAEWTSYPALTHVRDALKAVSEQEGVAYWDLLEVMGGPGSMPAWVASDPPLAGPDHVHFTPLGAKHVGTLLDRSLLAAYGAWRRAWRPASPEALRKRGAPTLPTGAMPAPDLVPHERP